MLDFSKREQICKQRIVKYNVLLQKLQNILEPIQFREIFFAIINVKISRILLSETELLKVFPLLNEWDILIGFAPNPVYARLDMSKGNWSSYFYSEKPTENTKELYLSYIGKDEQTLENAILQESLGSHIAYGKLLEIPECCSKEFSLNIGMLKNQGIDPIKIMLENTKYRTHLDPWCNIIGQYFGYTLISFTPCSFNCLNASLYSKFSYNLLRYYNPDFANIFFKYHTSAYIYTETFGVHRLKKIIKKSECVIEYENSNMETTDKNSPIALHLLKGNKIVINDHNNFIICYDEIEIYEVRNKSIILIYF